MKIVSSARFVKSILLIVTAAMLFLAGNSYAYYQVSDNNQPDSAMSSHADDQSTGVLESMFPTDNLWQVLQREFSLSHDANRPEVQAQIKWFLLHKKFINQIAKNATPYMYYILQQVKERHLPPELVLMPMIESGYDPFAYSPAGASGLWQMMPGTASGFGLKQNWWYDGRRDVVASTNAALNYLAYLQNFFNGNWMLAIAAYDSGEGTVLTAIRRNIAKGKSTDFWSLSLPRETKAYIPKLLALAEIISHPSRYPVKLPPIANKPYLTVEDIGTQIDLKTAAKLSDLSLSELLKLNPGFNRWATAPEGPYLIVLPIDKAATFRANLAKLPASKRVTWKRYYVVSGDSLGKIAHQFKTTVTLLKQVNKLKTDSIKVGEVLFIPLSTGQLPSQVIASAQKYMDVQQQSLPGPQKIVYTVEPNDTLWKIAHKFKVRESAIRYWNGMKKSAVLQPGQQVIMWVESKSRHESAARVSQVSYTVRSGDNLGKIARRFNTTIEMIRSINQLTGNMISPGQELMIYKNLLLRVDANNLVMYLIQSGDSLNSLALRYDTNPVTIKKLNGLSSSALKAGHKLVIVPHALPSENNLSLKPNNPPKEMVYIVQPNDNLAAIAAKFKTTVKKIKHWNPTIDGSDYLQPYELLVIYI